MFFFSDKIGKVRRGYRLYVEQGIAQPACHCEPARQPSWARRPGARAGRGQRPDLLRGGLRELGEEEKAEDVFDLRVLGRGDFVERVLREVNEMDIKRKARIPLSELIGQVTSFLGMEGEGLLTGRRKREVSSARALISYLAVKEMGYRFTEIGQALNIHPVNIARSLEKGEKVFDQYREKWAKRN